MEARSRCSWRPSVFCCLRRPALLRATLMRASA